MNDTKPIKSNKKNLALYQEPTFTIPYVISAILAIAIPENGFNSTAIDAFTELITKHVPSIAAYAQKSNFSEVSKIYFSSTSIIFIPWFVLFISNKDASLEEISDMKDNLYKLERRHFLGFFAGLQ